MSVSKLPSGKWRVRVKAGGKVVADRAFDLKGDANRWEAEQKRALLLGTFVAPHKGRVTVQQLADDWMSQRAHSVSPKTLETDRDNVRRLPATLRNRPVGTIRSADFDLLYADLLSRLARSTVTRARNSYSSLFAWAESQGRIATNPVLRSKVPRGTGTAATHEVWPFSYDELQAVTESIRVVSPANADIVLFLGLTGLRWGEMVALRVRDVSTLPTYALRVSRTKSDRQVVRSTTKSGKVRSVPLVAELIPIVQARMKGKVPEAPLFTTARGALLAGPNFKRSTRWADLGSGRRIHDLRHTAATLWLSNGVDLKTAQQWLGHSSAKLTADLYAHWLGTDADAAAIARLNSSLGDTAGTRAKSENRA